MNRLPGITNIQHYLKSLKNRLTKINTKNEQKQQFQKRNIRSSNYTKETENKLELSKTISKSIEEIPENSRRTVNKIVKKGDYFNVIYNLNTAKLELQKSDKLIYSSIPYDTGRKYMQRAAILTLLYPESTTDYLNRHKANIMTYIQIALKQTGHKKAKSEEYYNLIFEQPLFMIQILGRMLQHDETGPLSANLAGKFLFDINQMTGITGYLVEYIKFIIETAREFPIATNGDTINLIENYKNNELETDIYKQSYLTNHSHLHIDILPKSIQKEIENNLIAIDNYSIDITKPLLKSEVGSVLKNVRKKYVAHSIEPSILEPHFTNVLSTTNNNKINVVSDIHSLNGKLPFQNKNFNILVGDLSDSGVSDAKIRGIAIIGNHELSDLIPKEVDTSGLFSEFESTTWYKNLQSNPDKAWPILPIGSHKFYRLIADKMHTSYPNLHILNNESYMHNDVRYIGITLPVALSKRKDEAQSFIYKTLSELIAYDFTTPTVIISHAPLFNELSLLSPKSQSYNKNYTCSHNALFQLFENANIIGVIHGHHHIPASKGRHKFVDFAGKERFVVCSIYSKINTGFPLEKVLSKSLPKTISAKSISISNNSSNNKLTSYNYETPIKEIKGLYEETRGTKKVFCVEKTINGKRNRKRFNNIEDAIDYLNELNKGLL